MIRPKLYIYTFDNGSVTYAIQYPDLKVEYYFDGLIKGDLSRWRLSCWTHESLDCYPNTFEYVGEV